MKNLHTLQKLLEASGAQLPAPALHQVQVLLEAQLSHDEQREALYRSLQRRETNEAGVYTWRYIQDVYDGAFVYQENSSTDNGLQEKLFKRTFTLAEDGTATLGEPVEVRLERHYVPVNGATGAALESGSSASQTSGQNSGTIELRETCIGLREATKTRRFLRDDGTGRIKIISPGWGSSGYYSREVIERDIPTQFPKGTKMFSNHPTPTEEAERPEGDWETSVAVFTSDPVYEVAGPEGEGAYVDIRVYQDYHGPVEDRAENVGVSINGSGDYHIGEAEGRTGPIIDAITNGKSVDVVTRAGRGGMFCSLQESMRQSAGTSTTTSATSTSPAPSSSSTTSMKNQEDPNLRESYNSLQTRTQRLEESLISADARTLATEQISAAEMPQVTRDRLIESVCQRPSVRTNEDGSRELDREAFTATIESAVKSELEYLDKITESGKVRGMGAGSSGSSASSGDGSSSTTSTRESAAADEASTALSLLGL